MKNNILFPAEWHKQCAVQLTWPHSNTDWVEILEEVISCYVQIASEILKRQKLVIVCKNPRIVKYELRDCEQYHDNLILVEHPLNDTWARDHGAISILEGENKVMYDFTFNGWGLKFASNHDNVINRGLDKKGVLAGELKNMKHFVLEGGAIESDGKGTILTTSECLLSPNRNSHMSKTEVDEYMKEIFGLERVLWLDHGYLAGDDTDSHIDTLARYCDEHTVAYVKCDDTTDEHYTALLKMEEQLKTFVDYQGNPYKLIALPMAAAEYDSDRERLPATYANFLIMNDIVLLPFYKDKKKNEEAKNALQEAFPTREVIGINCSSLIKQHGSLHCITMQFPEGFIK